MILSPFFRRHGSTIGIPAIFVAAALQACAPADARSIPISRDASTAVTVRVTAAVDTLQFQMTTASGIVQARTAVDVAFLVAGKVVTVGPDEGSVVRAGDILSELDATDFRLALEQTQVQSDRAVQERDRYRPLLMSGSVSSNDMEKFEAHAEQTTAATQLARKHLGDTRLASPIGGVVAKRSVERGATVAAGQPVFTIMTIDSVRVRIGVPEVDVGNVHVGQTATVTVPAFGDTLFTGTVSLVGIAADPMTRSYAVEILVPNTSRRLKPGMVAEATIKGRTSHRVVSLPVSAVLYHAANAAFVFVFDTNAGCVRERAITIGTVRSDAIEITSGVDAGELVVIAGQQRVRDGSAVRLATGNATAGVP